MPFAEYADYDGLGLADLVAKKQVTPSEVLDAAIARIEAHNGTLNAVVHKPTTKPSPWRRASFPTAPSAACPS